MNCYSCDKDNWFSLGDLSKEGEILVCKECGAVSYRVEPDAEKKMREFYRKEYRPDPGIGNLVTTNHKLQYIRVFLKDYLEKLGDTKIFFGDIGCATGYLPAFFKHLGHKATGCEYTTSFRRFCEKWYGIPIPEELYSKRPYDMLSLYHVFEHMINPTSKLDGYISLLKDDGHFLISTPEWLDTLEEASGNKMQSFEILFPKPHINIFTKTSIKNVFNRVGLEIIKEDHIQYGQTYLLKKGIKKDIVVEDYKEQIEKLKKTKESIECFKRNEFEKAVDVWPNFPEAWIDLLLNKNMKDPKKQSEIVQKAEAFVSKNARWRGAVGWWHFQHKRYDEALKSFSYVMDIKPNEDTALSIGACLLETGKLNEAFDVYNIAHSINPQKWTECMNFMCKIAGSIPTWDERAMQEIANQAVSSAQKPEIDDKLFS